MKNKSVKLFIALMGALLCIVPLSCSDQFVEIAPQYSIDSEN